MTRNNRTVRQPPFNSQEATWIDPRDGEGPAGLSVCIVTPYPISRISGVSRQVEELGRTLRQLGVRVGGWSPAPSAEWSINGIKGLPLRSHVSRNAELAAKSVFRILLGRRGLSVVHAQQLHLQSAAALLAARFAGLGAVLTVHVRSKAFGRTRSIMQRIVDWMCLHFANAVVAVSPAVAATLPWHRVRVIPNGVDIDVFRPSREERIRMRMSLGLGSDRAVVFVGRWSRTKGLDTLFAAFGQVASKHRGIQLVVIGEPARDESPILPQSLMDPVSLQRVHIVGGLDNSAEVAGYLNAADIFALPSLSEGMPLALLEALACGLPVIASDIPAHRTLLESYECGWLAAPGNVPDLFRILETFVTNGSPPEWPARARQAAVVHHSSRIMAEAYLEVYADVLQMRPVNLRVDAPARSQESDPY